MKMKPLLPKAGVLAAAIFIASCSNNSDRTLQKPTLNVNDLSTELDPGNDFYRYVNKSWMDANPMPDDKSRFGWFDILLEQNRENLKAIFTEVTTGEVKHGTVAQKIGDFYNSGMDTLAIEKEGLSKLTFLLDKVDALKSSDDVIELCGLLQSYQLVPLFAYYVSADEKNSKMNIAGLWQTGLGLPDRDYYLEDDESSEEIRKAYTTFLTTIFTLSGDNDKTAEQKASDVLTFEKGLAKASYTRLQNRDPHLTYNKIDGTQLNKTYSLINWDAFFKGMNQPVPAEINVSQTSYVDYVGETLNSTSINTWKNYLESLIIRSFTSYLPKAYTDASFELYGKTIQGRSEMEPRWKRVQGVTSSALGEAVGQLFVERHFPEEAKTKMVNLVENLRVGFSQRIEKLEWMSTDTKVKAQDKLAAIKVKVGYPNKWRDYSTLEVKPDSYLENVLASNQFDFAFSMSKIGKAVDTEEWHMFPQQVNAYYNPSGNEIVFPAAILQPPFFYLDGDDAVNYGAIGVVIGHEMTHGFDDKGSLFDKEGNLENWWTSDDSTRFAARTQILVDQFNSFQVKDSVYADGELTLGENIADLGGLNIAYEAYLNAIKDKGEIAKIGGLTDTERFFMSYANIWAQNIRDKEMLRLTKVDVHSLGEFRVNGALANVDLFYETFNITEDEALYVKPADRAKIW